MSTAQKQEQPSILRNVRSALESDPPNIELAIARVHENWSREPSRSRQNWRAKIVPLQTTSGYKSSLKWKHSEVLLERSIVEKCSDRLNKDSDSLCLWNQMPVASGLLPKHDKENPNKRTPSEGRRAIDLVYRPDGPSGPIEFLELKVMRGDGSRDSLREAALELLEYGILYLFSRKNLVDLGYDKPSDDNSYDVLNAPIIRLRVLSTSSYYAGQSIGSFPIDATNTALKKIIANNGFGNLEMDIGFQVLADHGDWYSCFTGKETWPKEQSLAKALGRPFQSDTCR